MKSYCRPASCVRSAQRVSGWLPPTEYITSCGLEAGRKEGGLERIEPRPTDRDTFPGPHIDPMGYEMEAPAVKFSSGRSSREELILATAAVELTWAFRAEAL